MSELKELRADVAKVYDLVKALVSRQDELLLLYRTNQEAYDRRLSAIERRVGGNGSPVGF